MGSTEECAQRMLIQSLTNEVERLRAIVAAQRSIIAWYEEEMGRSCYADEDMPEDLATAEQALKVAETAGGE